MYDVTFTSTKYVSHQGAPERGPPKLANPRFRFNPSTLVVYPAPNMRERYCGDGGLSYRIDQDQKLQAQSDSAEKHKLSIDVKMHLDEDMPLFAKGVFCDDACVATEVASSTCVALTHARAKRANFCLYIDRGAIRRSALQIFTFA